ncbi:MAG TPA: CDP-glycerol glycerophosphotransferase family protein [Propionibacteriaceae bacterium]|nr:CDP-glycerol glycerophosphotransferase family protein [Propionibacteriaceae bacterium]
MAAATHDADDGGPASRRTLVLAAQAVAEIGLAVMALLAFTAALSTAPVLAAVLVTFTAVGVATRCWLAARSDGQSWLGQSAGARSLLVSASAVSLVREAGFSTAAAAVLLALIVAVSLIGVESHLERLTAAQLPYVAHLPGIDRLPALPPLGPAVAAGALVTSVLGSWLAVLVQPPLSEWLWTVVVLASAAPVLALAILGRRRVLAAIALDKRIGKAVAAYAPEFVVYTARPDDASYQVSMWLPYLQRSGRRFIIVTRETVPAAALAAVTDVPIVERRRLTDLDTVITPATRAAFYVNASSGNGALVRYHQLTHVYLGHGDSDKPPSYNPTHAMFDRIFAAGPAAIRRYAAHGVSISADKFEVVGRPQVEGVRPGEGPISAVDQPVVLYAPTWRGHVEETLLYSLPVGERIVRALLARNVSVIFRPHPFSYDFEADREAIRAIHRVLADDARKTGRSHRWGPAAERELGILDCINASDAMISDVSSVASDYLFSAKPFAMVAVSTRIDTFEEEYPIARAAYVLDGQLANLDAVLDLMLGADPMSSRRRSVKVDYLGDFPAEQYADAFVSAVRRVVDQPPDHGARGIESGEEPPPPSTRASLKQRFANLVRDAAMVGLGALSTALAAVGAPLAAAGAAVLTLAAVVWFRRGWLAAPRRVRLLGTDVIPRTLVLAALVVASVEVSSPGVAVLVVAGVVVLAIIGEQIVESALRPQGLEAVNLPGAQLSVRPILPWGTTTMLTWAVLVVGWVVVLAGLPTVLLGTAAGALLLAFGEALARALTRVHRSVRAEEHLRATMQQYRPQFAVYFASTVGAAYQVGMWLPYLRRLGRPFIIITRTIASLRQLESVDDVPVIYRPTLRSLEDVIVDSMTTAFYVNNAVRNTHFIERRQLSHIWLNHGDSEKPACYNPVHAIYDRIFVAGQAGIDRYARHGVHIPADKFQIVGRPQVEAISKARAPIGQISTPTVLYAPTWRGPFADSRVYSVPLGSDIVAALLERGATVIFRAHPFNYRFPDAAAMIESIGRLLAADSESTGRAHRWGPAAEHDMTIEECFNASDAMISDVSAVVSDYLQSDKPFSIVSVGRSPAQLLADAPAARAAYVLREDLTNLKVILDELLVTDTLAPIRSETRVYYLGDFPPEDYADGFLAAARAVVDADRA